MKRHVFWSADAIDELDSIIRYIARENPLAAGRVATAIRSAGNRLGLAAIGRIGRISGTYEKVVPRLPYVIAYSLEALPDGSEGVVILRVIHGARNWTETDWPT